MVSARGRGRGWQISGSSKHRRTEALLQSAVNRDTGGDLVLQRRIVAYAGRVCGTACRIQDPGDETCLLETRLVSMAVCMVCFVRLGESLPPSTAHRQRKRAEARVTKARRLTAHCGSVNNNAVVSGFWAWARDAKASRAEPNHRKAFMLGLCTLRVRHCDV